MPDNNSTNNSTLSRQSVNSSNHYNELFANSALSPKDGSIDLATHLFSNKLDVEFLEEDTQWEFPREK
jgi:hypothetical protein